MSRLGVAALQTFHNGFSRLGPVEAGVRTRPPPPSLDIAMSLQSVKDKSKVRVRPVPRRNLAPHPTARAAIPVGSTPN